MKIYVMTKADETVAVLDNTLSGALHYFDDEFHRYLDTGAGTFDLSIVKPHKMYSNGSKGTEDDFQYLKENHFLVFRYKEKDFKFTIRRVEETESSLRLFCEDLSFDLLNEYRGPYKADKAYPMAKYINDCLTDSGYIIGTNEFAKNERTLEWDGDATVLERMLSIANSFGAEVEFETVLNSDRSVKENRVNLLKRVGVDRPDIELKYGREVNSIRRNVDITELITAIKPRGHEEDGKVTTIKDVVKTVYDDNGNEFFTKKGSEYIYCPTSNQVYGNPKQKNGGYIVGQFSYDTNSDTELFNRAQSVLQTKCVPAYEFEIEGFYDVNIGDTIRAIDEGYNPILLLEARISEQAICFSDPTKNKTVYTNYKILDNQVNQNLLDRIEEVKKYAEQINKTYIFTIENTGSPMFTNGEGEVTFTAKVEKNNEDITADYTKFNWVKQKKDGSLDDAWNAAHREIGKTLTVKPTDFDDTATFTYQTLDNDVIIGGASGVVTKVYDGENGKTPIKGVDYFDGQDGTDGLSSYLHIRYSQNANGTPMTENPNGAKYIGMQPSQNPNASTVPADYSWSLFTGKDGIPGETGADGKTSYLHIRYSNDNGKTFTGNSGEDAGSYIGQYVDFTKADSNDVKSYTWSKTEGPVGPKGDDGLPGKDGVGIKDTAFAYQASSNGNTPPTGTWSATVPSVSKGQYLWTRTTWTYTDNSNEVGYSVAYVAKDGNNGSDGIAGKDGVGIKDTNVTYAKSTTGTTAPTSGWTATVPSVPDGQFLWTKTVWTYTDNSTETGYSVGKMGTNGANGSDGKNGSDGVGIKSTAVTYQASTSGTSAPTGTWSTTVPSVAANQYLWTRTILTYTNNTSSTAYSVGRMGANGATGATGATGAPGKDGANGANGVSVSSIVEEYYVSTSPTGQAGGTWSTTVPNNADPNKYVWRRMKTTLSNNNVTYTNPVLIQGMTGIYPYIGPTQPASPKEGQQWWKSDASGNVTNFYVYKSGSWQGQTIQQSILNIVELNAVEINSSTITGTTIDGSKFTSTFENKVLEGSTNERSGTVTIESGQYKSVWQEKNSAGALVNQSGLLRLDEYSLFNAVYDNNNSSGIPLGSVDLQPGGLFFTMKSLPGYTGVLTMQDSLQIPSTPIPASSGWAQYSTSETNQPRASRSGRTVQLSGAFKNNALIAANAAASTMGVLPVWARPERSVNTVVQASSTNVYLLSVEPNGNLVFQRHRGGVSGGFEYKDCGAGSWLNIAVTYSAGDM